MAAPIQQERPAQLQLNQLQKAALVDFMFNNAYLRTEAPKIIRETEQLWEEIIDEMGARKFAPNPNHWMSAWEDQKEVAMSALLHWTNRLDILCRKGRSLINHPYFKSSNFAVIRLVSTVEDIPAWNKFVKRVEPVIGIIGKKRLMLCNNDTPSRRKRRLVLRNRNMKDDGHMTTGTTPVDLELCNTKNYSHVAAETTSVESEMCNKMNDSHVTTETTSDGSELCKEFSEEEEGSFLGFDVSGADECDKIDEKYQLYKAEKQALQLTFTMPSGTASREPIKSPYQPETTSSDSPKLNVPNKDFLFLFLSQQNEALKGISSELNLLNNTLHNFVQMLKKH